ncbi:MAG TPA: hypothetical protein VJ760_05000, partial [Nitrospiraceae bacterium]|nr:hypothetical protein [Nitrospiraceae bacterium]
FMILLIAADKFLLQPGSQVLQSHMLPCSLAARFSRGLKKVPGTIDWSTRSAVNYQPAESVPPPLNIHHSA